MEFSDYLYIDETSPTKLKWAIDIRCGKNYNRVKYAKGDVAGHISRNIFVVHVRGHNYKVARVIQRLLGKDIENMVVDHIDGNSLNNTLTNLRICTRRMNNRNSKRGDNNTSGTTGVGWSNKKRKTRYSLYAYAQWTTLENKVYRKYFSVEKFGLIPALKIAIDFRTKMIDCLNTLGAGYTDRHGK